MSKSALNRASCCCCLRFLGTILAHIYSILNSSVSIKRTVSRFMLTLSAIILTVNLRSDRTSYFTRSVLSPFCVADCRLLHCSSPIMVLLSENILCQRKSCALDIASAPKTCCIFPCVLVTLSLSLTLKNTAYRCAMFRASISMTRFTNTYWHVTHLLHTEAL